MKDNDPTNSAPAIPREEGDETRLRELAILFLRLGFTAFGGPAAHIAMMQQEIVERRKWVTKERFLDLLGASNLIPGPSSTELAIFIGFERARWAGLALAGICFILPAAFLVSLIAWEYVRYGHLPQMAGVLYGVKPVVVAVIAQAIWNLGRTAVKTRFLAVVGILATVMALLGANPLLMLIGAGVVVAGARMAKERPKGSLKPLLVLIIFIGVLVAAPMLLGRFAAPRSLSLPSLFLAFLKLGSVVYGSGYVLLAFLRADLVTGRGWLTSAQLLDAVAVGQITPGPVFTTATFIGFLLAGPRGAVVATIGMFLPAFLFVAVGGPLAPRLRKSPLAGAFLDGVNVASLALMAVVTWQLALGALTGPFSIVLAVVSVFILARYRVNSAWLMLGGAVLGVVGR